MTDFCNQEKSGLLSLSQALHYIQSNITPVTCSEIVCLRQALGRILAAPLYANIDLPPYRNSSMDGYAFSSADALGQTPFVLEVVGTSWAGHPFTGTCEPGQCVQIFTGARVPEGADCVVMQEQVTRRAQQAIFHHAGEPGFNIRSPGEDIQKGEQLLAPGKKLTAADLGLIAAAGIYKIPVKRKLHIGFFSTGNELVALGHKLQAGQIYDSNRYTLEGLLQDPCYQVSDLGVLADDAERIQTALEQAAQSCDVLLTTGGASVGEADFIKPVLEKIGQVNFWKIAMKPGKPLAYGNIGACHFFALPGNPVSVIATCQHIVLPALRQLCGGLPNQALRLKAYCRDNLKKSPGRLEFQRGILSQTKDGRFFVQSAGKQGSNILSAISRANCYIILSAESAGVKAGECVEVQPFTPFVA